MPGRPRHWWSPPDAGCGRQQWGIRGAGVPAPSSLRATVFDLPLICELGLDHVLAQAEGSRISFIQGDLRGQDLPDGYDLITFKSMLHDWPPQDALRFIEKAARALVPGGTLLIYERGTLEFGGEVPPMSMVPNLLFFRSYRSPQVYIEQLQRLGFLD